ncbi:hypothetical protein D3C81_1520100 [compost metagenome]
MSCQHRRFCRVQACRDAVDYCRKALCSAHQRGIIRAECNFGSGLILISQQNGRGRIDSTYILQRSLHVRAIDRQTLLQLRIKIRSGHFLHIQEEAADIISADCNCNQIRRR